MLFISRFRITYSLACVRACVRACVELDSNSAMLASMARQRFKCFAMLFLTFAKLVFSPCVLNSVDFL